MGGKAFRVVQLFLEVVQQNRRLLEDRIHLNKRSLTDVHCLGDT